MSVYRVSSSKSSDSIFPKVRPTLDLDFANSKTLDPRITFTRSSGGSYVGADGLIKYAGVNEPRFDHDPVTGESLGLLVEEQRTNVARYSEDLGNSWIKANVTTAVNSTTAPDGTLTADSILTSLAGATQAYLVQVVSLGLSTYTFSFYAKGSTSRSSAFIDQFGLGGGSSTRARGSINLTSGVVTYFTLDSGTSISATKVGNGWWRCQTTFNVTVAGTIEIRIGNSDIDQIYVWGAQVEAGAFPTSYIPTTTAAVTRAADVARISGANLTSWYNYSEGTFYGEVNFNSTLKNIFSTIIGVNFNGNNGIMYAIQGTSAYPNKVAVGLVNFNSLNWFPVAKNERLFSKEYRLGSFIGYPASFDGPYPSIFHLGYNPGNPAHLNGNIKRLTFWPKRFPDAQLKSLSTY